MHLADVLLWTLQAMVINQHLAGDVTMIACLLCGVKQVVGSSSTAYKCFHNKCSTYICHVLYLHAT